MRKSKVDECVKVCEEFLKRANDFYEALDAENKHPYNVAHGYVSDSLYYHKTVSALKRQSMELTRELARFRRPN